MPARGPFTLPKGISRLPTLFKVLTASQKRPPVGLTQGGSSRRKMKGAKVAATNAIIHQS